MLHKIMLNGANYVSDERRSAFISTLEQNDSTPLLPDCEQPAVDEPRVENPSANGGDEPSLPTPLMPWRAHLDHSRVLESLERGLERSYDHQSETMRVHQHYLTNEASYVSLLAQLMHDQGTLVGNSGSAPAQLELALATLQSLSHSIARFHDHQAKTLSVHSQFLEQQAAYAQSFMELLQRQYGEILRGQGAPETAAFVTSSPGGNGNGHGNGHGNSRSGAATAEVNQAGTLSPLPTTLHSAVAAVTPLVPAASAVHEGSPGPDRAPGDARGMDSPAPAPSPDPAPNAGADSIATSLLSIVSDKTGYPVEMLDLEMDLEADLGIDSIKRVEILGALEDAHPELGEIEPEALTELRTLASILQYATASDARALLSTGTGSPKKA